MSVTFDDLDLAKLYTFIGWSIQHREIEAVFFELKGWYLQAHTLPDMRYLNIDDITNKRTFFQTLKPKLNIPQTAMSQCVSVKDRHIEDVVIQLVSKLNSEIHYNSRYLL
ncbi:hypothetical protein M9194_00610 [Vibrio sp. S4M6]|uniref:hypothetical protein n=1 Tax=Vibrio sinus TaxID=2946865 RepID=UPI00202A3CCA|nr:hypothetical protein [Vibrio sinus]MCL9779932.1 hypothetical protein [Vibrio sinus]